MAVQVGAEVCFEQVRNRPRSVALLIGAGCSLGAGIPLASGFVDEVRRLYRHRCSRLPDAEANRFNAVVGQLAPDEWLDLFRRFVEPARVNVAQLCIGELVGRGTVDRILTTNFDSLLVRASAMSGVFPAIYDCGATSDLDRVLNRDMPAIYYLHGQAYGLGMLTASDEINNHAVKVRRIVQQSIRGRTLIVCGYSGECDGVLETLRDSQEVTYPVFWVPFNGVDADRALFHFGARRHLWVVENYDADEFFFDMLVELEREPAKLIQRLGRPPAPGGWERETQAGPASLEAQAWRE